MNCTQISAGVHHWVYWEGHEAITWSLDDQNPGLHFRATRDHSGERITVKAVNPDRVDSEGNGLFTMATFDNTDAGWMSAQAYVLKLMDTFGWTTLAGVVKAQVEARMALPSYASAVEV